VENLHPALDGTLDHSSFEKLGPAFIRLKQRHRRLRQRTSHHEPGQPSAGSEIDHASVSSAFLRPRQGCESLRVEKVALYGSRTEKSCLACRDKDFSQDVRGNGAFVGVRHRRIGQLAGEMTM
jgi:hypothetical protein